LVNWVDLLVLVLAIVAAVSGARQGMLTALASFLGVLGGAIVGLQLAPLLIEQFNHPVTRVAFGVSIVVLLVALGETLGVWVGRSVRQRIDHTQLTKVDNAGGAIVQGLVVFIVAWLIALPLTSVAAMPGLVRSVRGSAILGGVDSVMPAFAKQLPGDLRNLMDASGFPAAVAPFSTTPRADTAPPDPVLQVSPIVRKVRPSVLKIRGKASQCARALEGSGFVIAKERVMTNAHVVAGTDEVEVEVGSASLPARVVHYDPDTDVAILSVPDLTAPALPVAPVKGEPGADGIVLGYPLDGPYAASASRIRQRIQLNGQDIYDRKAVRRDVYTIRAVVKSGNSGGPLVDPDGRLVGVVFGAAVDDPETGFALTADEVSAELDRALAMTQRVSTGRCAS
jgi:S1-C subfamily serine protease